MFPYSLQLQRKHIGTDVEVERLVMSFFILYRSKFCADLKGLFIFLIGTLRSEDAMAAKIERRLKREFTFL